MSQVKRNRQLATKDSYIHFKKLNGNHPFQTKVSEGHIKYHVRKKKGGKIAFFNFQLAKEMGLISENHPDELTDELTARIIETFSLVIINEYDIQNKIQYPSQDILPNTFMATRYLQLQHPDKTGRTSGDGRTIWNGVIENKGVTWDISSCGTGATRLSPACNINKKFYKTGDPSISYGCGLSEVSEGMETLFFSEVLAENGIKTERILAIIEFEKGLSINVRAYPNLMRPSHFFCHLKQGNLKTLKEVCDYYIDRQIENGEWKKNKFNHEKDKYFELANMVCLNFARASAKFEDEYIFCWLDWDGDNILMDGGIIDYGSIRQFGLFHGEYRFDDVQRFSTNILEQKKKAKYIVQCFIQIADFLTNGKRKSLNHFRDHEILKKFDDYFEEFKNQNILKKIGLKENYQNYLLNDHKNLVKEFRCNFAYFERAKSKRPAYRVADGINRDAIFCMRDVLRELPQIFLTKGKRLTSTEFMEVAKSSYAKKTDLKVTSFREKKISSFQDCYFKIVDLITRQFSISNQKALLEITMRSSVINKFDRVTGDSITYIVQKVLRNRKKMTCEEIYSLSRDFMKYQNLNPDLKVKFNSETNQQNKKMMKSFLSIVREFREGI